MAARREEGSAPASPDVDMSAEEQRVASEISLTMRTWSGCCNRADCHEVGHDGGGLAQEGDCAAASALLPLADTSDFGLVYSREHQRARGYADASWEVKHSTSGWLVQWQSAALTLGSRKQNRIALSSCEAEIIALSEAAKDLRAQVPTWHRRAGTWSNATRHRQQKCSRRVLQSRAPRSYEARTTCATWSRHSSSRCPSCAPLTTWLTSSGSL